jgi:hypothetical protein
MANPLPVILYSANELRRELRKAMTTPNKVKYIPNDVLEQLTGNGNIERVVRDISCDYSTPPKEREDFVTKLCRDCPILVAILVHESRAFHGNLRGTLLEALVQHGITDKDLTLSSKCPEWLVDPDHQTDYHILYETQWQFKAAVFHEVGQRQKFDKNTYLQKKHVGNGGYSRVYKVRIQSSHQKVYSLPGVRISFLVYGINYRETRNNG